MTIAAFRTGLLAAIATIGSLCPESIDPATQTSHPVECATVQTCAALGDSAMRSGDSAGALRYYRSQLQFSEDVEDKRGVVSASNNLTEVWLRKKDDPRARAWARLALRVEPENQLAKSNLEQIDVRLRTRSWATDVSGVYVKYSGRGASWDTLRAEDPRDGKIQFYLIAYRMGFGWRQWGPASYGDLDGLAVLEQPRYAVYASDSSFPTCAVSLEFRGDAAAVAQRGDCGFGYGVNINGNWERICAGTGTDCRDTPSGVPAR